MSLTPEKLPGIYIIILQVFSLFNLMSCVPDTWPPAVQVSNSESLPLSPEEELKTIVMPPGYKLELVASEPMVEDPIALDFDTEGRMWVIEYIGYMPDESARNSLEPICRIVVLEDSDDDGRMDVRHVFADNLILPRSIKVLDKGVLIIEPPNLWLARDIDGDLKADSRLLISKDFGRLDGNPEHNANGLLWGMDNRIHTSEHNYNLKISEGNFVVEPSIARGQWGLSMDDAGRIYRNWNEQPLFVDLLADYYYLRNPNLTRTRGLFELLLPDSERATWPIHATRGVNRGYRDGILRDDGTIASYVSAGSPTIYRGDRLPKELFGNAFVTESAGNLVHRLLVNSDQQGNLSAKNAYERAEFIASSDERFRPVNLYSAPDGTLIVVDMYRGVVQEGEYQTDYLKDYIKRKKLSLPVKYGRIWRVVHNSSSRGTKPSLTKVDSMGLVKLLSHPNGWWRDAAQRLLVERKSTDAIIQLKDTVRKSKDYRTKLHALWTLAGLAVTDPDLLAETLKDESAFVRAASIRLAEPWLGSPEHPLQRAVLDLVGDQSVVVQQQLAASLGYLPSTLRLQFLQVLLELHGDNPVVVDAVISGLSGLELQLLHSLVQTKHNEKKLSDPLVQLASIFSYKLSAADVQVVINLVTEGGRQPWQRQALLEGLHQGFQAALGRTNSESKANTKVLVKLSTQPAKLIGLAASTDDSTKKLVDQVLEMLFWPGKVIKKISVKALTPAELSRFQAGEKIYVTNCAACHQLSGQGKAKIAANLITSKIVNEQDPGIAIRVLLAGKEGEIALMPPFGTLLDDNAIADVVTYLRRAWTHTGSVVSTSEVKEVRGLTASRKSPWTMKELFPWEQTK